LTGIGDDAGRAGISEVLIRRLPEVRSYGLSEKSLYDIRLEDVFERNHEDYSRLAREYAEMPRKKGANDYTVSVVDSAGDLKLLADSITARRAEMGIKDEESDPIKDILVVRNDTIKADRETYFSAAGFSEELLSSERVVFIDEAAGTLSFGELMDELREVTGIEGLPHARVVIGDKTGFVVFDRDGPDDALRAEEPLLRAFVKMEKGLISQLYRMVVEMIATDGKLPGEHAESFEALKPGYRVFRFMPDVEPYDLEEVRKYEERLRRILIAA